MNEILLAEQGKKEGAADSARKTDGADGEESAEGDGGSCSTGSLGGGSQQQSSQTSQTWICDIFQVIIYLISTMSTKYEEVLIK